MTVFFDFGCWEVSVFLILKGKKIQFDQQQKDTMRLLILLAILVVLSHQTTDIGPSNFLKDNQYTIVYNNLQIQDINGVPVSFTSQQIYFQGCNGNKANYELDRWQFKITNGWYSTRMACPIDNDYEIQRLFQTSTRITLSSYGKVNFYKGKTLLLTLEQQQDTAIFNPLAGKDLIIKSTILNIDSILRTVVRFTESHVSFKGCNSNSASYSVKTNNGFRITSFWAATLLPCQKDNDGLIARLFSNSRYYSLSINGEVRFFNQEGSLLLTLGSKILDVSPFSGKNYVIAKTSLNNNFVIGTDVSFSKDTIHFKGCNYNNGKYALPAPKQIRVGLLWTSTKMGCQIDFDSSIVKVFIQSKSYDINHVDGSVSFFDQKSQLTLKLRIKQEIQPLSQFIGLKGLFKIQSNSVRKEINGVQVLFIRGSISFGHCNSNTASYSTGDNNSFSITSIWMTTMMFCDPDYDSQIRSLFSDSVRYELRDNGFAFFDSQSKQLVEIQRLR